MADTLLVRALKSKPKSLNLSSKKLDKVPKAIGKLDCVIHLQLKNNRLKTLPHELSYLDQVKFWHCFSRFFNIMQSSETFSLIRTKYTYCKTDVLYVMNI